ncbi:unnamed protein product [Didymodactylos carnosus]|uniref:Uncharacterized protein n=1 Tax=Didymodactylos carnosus TaxID=1234261 RepID=A0A814ZID2_9BILA|nr:unnamed protein product [Didymodactylos carnosus]CAF1499343.1 unnamed protein product [Didymodactylos carnosus]CAF4008719.1 unnamed protein product [Didymodactylos carnosus]CAF4287943.1 unnamed protein product [Didymodactylos carnosus]
MFPRAIIKKRREQQNKHAKQTTIQQSSLQHSLPTQQNRRPQFRVPFQQYSFQRGTTSIFDSYTRLDTLKQQLPLPTLPIQQSKSRDRTHRSRTTSQPLITLQNRFHQLQQYQSPPRPVYTRIIRPSNEPNNAPINQQNVVSRRKPVVTILSASTTQRIRIAQLKNPYFYIKIKSESGANISTLHHYIYIQHGQRLLNDATQLLIIIGTNDLGIHPRKQVIDSLATLIVDIQHLYPNIQRVIVHDVLIRTKLFGAFKQSPPHLIVNEYNNRFHQLSNELKFPVVSSPVTQEHLYDRLHLRDRALPLLISTIISCFSCPLGTSFLSTYNPNQGNVVPKGATDDIIFLSTPVTGNDNHVPINNGLDIMDVQTGHDDETHIVVPIKNDTTGTDFLRDLRNHISRDFLTNLPSELSSIFPDLDIVYALLNYAFLIHYYDFMHWYANEVLKHSQHYERAEKVDFFFARRIE